MEHNVIYSGNTRYKLYSGSERRVMGGEVASPYDDLGYIKDGKTFHLDGISIGDNTNAWTDLIGGIIFPVVSGVTHDTDHFTFASGHSVMVSDPQTTLSFGSTGTLEVVADYGYNMGVIYAGAVETLCCITFNNKLYTFSSKGPSGPIYNMSASSALQYHITFNSLYLNGISQSSSGTDYATSNGKYCVIGNGNSGTNRPFVGNIYSIRYYNRVLTAEERVNNIAVDRLRFNLALS